MFRVYLLILCLLAAELNAQVLVQGHRGARGERPENTLAAFEHALKIGVDVLELDLAVSRDNVLVISHDLQLNTKLCSKPNGQPAKAAPIRSLSLKELQQFDCGSQPNPRFPGQQLVPGERMPSLRELFDWLASSSLANAKTVQLNIETKINPLQPELTPEPEAYARLLVDEIQRAGLTQRAIVQSFDYRTLKWAKKFAPEIRVSQLSYQSFVDLVAAVRALPGEYISPDWQSISREMVEQFHANGIRVAPWTANTPEAWAHLLELGVDEIITDYPTALIEFLRERQLRRP